MRIRGFEAVKESMLKNDGNYIFPIRSTRDSAGYDLFSPVDIAIPAKNKAIVWTNIKVYMFPDEVFQLYIRSSMANKKGLILNNQVGIVDSDYYSNKDNDGNIGVCLYNQTDNDIEIRQGDKIAQGIFMNYLIADNCNSEEERVGGWGSTGERK